jgi:predicted nuclease with RNAse H fold
MTLSDAIKNFASYIDESARKADEAEKATIIAAPLSATRKAKFREAFLEEYTRLASLRWTFESFGALSEETTDEPERMDLCQVEMHEFHPRRIYIDRPQVTVIDFGSAHGRGFAALENATIMKELLRPAPEEKVAEWETIHEVLDGTVRILEAKSGRPTVILAPWKFSMSETILRSGKFRYADDALKRGVRKLLGYYQGIPVVEYAGGVEQPVLVMALLRAASMKVFEPLSIDVSELSEPEKSALRKQQPEIDDQQLKLWVSLTVKESFKVHVLDPTAYVVVRLRSQ